MGAIRQLGIHFVILIFRASSPFSSGFPPASHSESNRGSMFQSYFPFIFERCTNVNAMNISPDSPSCARSEESWTITGIDNPAILQYFTTINEGRFQATSQLFASDGALQPPFAEAVVGPEAIAAYLEQEAKGFILEPQYGVSTLVDNDCTEFLVGGKVHTPWFSVNVSWLFILSPGQEIFVAKVKLLASLQELVYLRR